MSECGFPSRRTRSTSTTRSTSRRPARTSIPPASGFSAPWQIRPASCSSVPELASEEHSRRGGVMRRRNFLSATALSGMAVAALQGAVDDQDPGAETPQSVPVHWLDGGAPSGETGVSWGVPWPRGAFRRDQKFVLTAAGGQALLLQSWPLAYWPDGSLKWSGFATVAGPG